MINLQHYENNRTYIIEQTNQLSDGERFVYLKTIIESLEPHELLMLRDRFINGLAAACIARNIASKKEVVDAS